MIVGSRVRAPHRGRVSQHGGRHRRRRLAARALSQDAHPRRSAVLREVLLHAGRSRLPLLRHALRAHRARWSAGTSGIPRRPAWRRSAARRCSSIPTAIGWHPSEKARVRRGAARRLAHHPALARDRQRRLRRGGESRRATRGRRSTGSSSGAARSWPIRSARCSPKARTTGKRSSSSSAIRAASKRSAATGPSCATAASTPTRAILSRVLD